MILPDYRHYVGATVLVHSAKGSTWENHKYIKRVDGTYYYPNDYKGGRHIKDLNGSEDDSDQEDWEKTFYKSVDLINKKSPGMFDIKNVEDLEDWKKTLRSMGVDPSQLSDGELYRMLEKASSHYENSSQAEEEIEDWERTLYDDIERTLEANPGLFDPADIVNLQDFELTLAEFAGVDTEKLSPDEIERMRQKVIDHYADEQSARTLSEDDIANLAQEVIRGNFGNGSQRRELLGKNYQEVQDRVNQILRTQGSRSIDDTSKKEEAKKETKKSTASSSSNAKALDMEKVMGVYRRGQTSTAKKKEEEKKKAQKNKTTKGKRLS